MMTLLPRNVPTSHTKIKVGMLGGFFANFSHTTLAQKNGEKAYLCEYELGRMRNPPEESEEYGQHLLSDFEGRRHYERQFSEK
jgi:hypothetical protein